MTGRSMPQKVPGSQPASTISRSFGRLALCAGLAWGSIKGNEPVRMVASLETMR
jgi:hypothetical protein